MTTAAYQSACEAHAKAFAEYEVVRDAFRANKIAIGDFIAAKEIYDAVWEQFDIAFAIEAAREEVDEVVETDSDEQLSLPI